MAATYNSGGQPVSVADTNGDTVQVGYTSGGDVASVTDPLGRQFTQSFDGVGRVTGMSNAVGESVQFSYNSFSRMTGVTDSAGASSSMSFDSNANLVSLTDARNTQNPTKISYDNMDRVQSRTDPLGVAESYQYDGDGNLIQSTDRRGKVTTIQYDALNRRTFVGFGTSGSSYESTINYTWDAGNRLTQVVDSIAGTTTFGYDNLDRLTSVSPPQGSIAYTYDAIGRRQTMTVAGQPQVTYSYDAANHVIAVTQGTSTAQLGYDAVGRRTSLTLPNGVVASYSYDSGSQLSGISYAQGSTVLGNLQYIYDLAGRRTSVSGSFARTGLPQPLTNVSYNVANQLTQFGGATLTYDAAGNLTNDGTHAYTWDARNHLVAIDNGSTASFTYDAFGRRASKTISGTTTSYLYDGPNVVQEIGGGSPSANLITGGVDEIFTRADSLGARDFLLDGIGGTVALTDPTGVIQSQYTYEPYGNTTVSGQSTTNPFQYTGREDDGTGLYYYRARYYSPGQQRFIGQDPIRLAGGPNLYQYGASGPSMYRDPSGKILPLLAAGCLAGMTGYFWSQAWVEMGGRKSDSGWQAVRGAAQGCVKGALFGLAFEGVGFALDALAGLGPEAIGAEELGAGASEKLAPPIKVIGNLDDVRNFALENGGYGYDYLDDPFWTSDINDQWIEEGTDFGSYFESASDVTSGSTFNGGPYNGGFTMFGVEIGQLINAGYSFNGQLFLPPF